MKKSKIIYLFALLALSFSYPSSYVEAQSSESSKKQIKYKKARALTANIGCLGCWYTECDKDIECMKLLDPGTVFKNLEGLIDEET